MTKDEVKLVLPCKCDSVTIDNDQLTNYDLSENDMVLCVEQLFS